MLYVITMILEKIKYELWATQNTLYIIRIRKKKILKEFSKVCYSTKT